MLRVSCLRRSAILVLSALSCALLVVAVVGVEAKLMVTEFTGMVTPPVVMDPGATFFPGGNIHVRGLVLVFYDNFSDSRVLGNNTIEANWNLDGNGFGPGWGTYSITSEVYPGGSWEGKWTGRFHEDGTVTLKCVGHGMGEFRGLKAIWDYNSSRIPHVTGRILDPTG
jgi:hypothetical protein